MKTGISTKNSPGEVGCGKFRFFMTLYHLWSVIILTTCLLRLHRIIGVYEYWYSLQKMASWPRHSSNTTQTVARVASDVPSSESANYFVDLKRVRTKFPTR